MKDERLFNMLEDNPIIAAIKEKNFDEAVVSPANVIFLLGGSILSIEKKIITAHNAGKLLFLHIDLTEGIGKDRTGIEYLANLGLDGIISTRINLIKAAADFGLYTVQRFFLLDSQGVDAISDMMSASSPDIAEIMPGVIGKAIEKFSKSDIPVIAGGLIETKQEVTNAINLGAFAVSTGKKELWYI